jgi:hypothetical protein
MSFIVNHANEWMDRRTTDMNLPPIPINLFYALYAMLKSKSVMTFTVQPYSIACFHSSKME